MGNADATVAEEEAAMEAVEAELMAAGKVAEAKKEQKVMGTHQRFRR